jgi:hypothetical protein
MAPTDRHTRAPYGLQRIIRLALGGFFLVPALLKALQPSQVLANVRMVSDAPSVLWAVPLLIGVQGVLGLAWLFTGIREWHLVKPLLALTVTSIFGVLLFHVVRGFSGLADYDCGCFGNTALPHWLPISLALAAGLGCLLVTHGPGGRMHRGAGPVLVIGAFALAWHPADVLRVQQRALRAIRHKQVLVVLQGGGPACKELVRKLPVLPPSVKQQLVIWTKGAYFPECSSLPNVRVKGYEEANVLPGAPLILRLQGGRIRQKWVGLPMQQGGEVSYAMMASIFQISPTVVPHAILIPPFH